MISLLINVIQNSISQATEINLEGRDLEGIKIQKILDVLVKNQVIDFSRENQYIVVSYLNGSQRVNINIQNIDQVEEVIPYKIWKLSQEGMSLLDQKIRVEVFDINQKNQG